MDFRLLVTVNSLEEANAAMNAVMALRESSKPRQTKSTLEPLPLVNDLVRAIDFAPMNPVKQAVLETLYKTEPGLWLPYPDLASAVAESGACQKADAFNRTQAALRDLSWQVREALPAAALVGLHKPIEALADRTRSGGKYQYRLTNAGRQAVRMYFS